MTNRIVPSATLPHSRWPTWIAAAFCVISLVTAALAVFEGNGPRATVALSLAGTWALVAIYRQERNEAITAAEQLQQALARPVHGGLLAAAIKHGRINP